MNPTRNLRLLWLAQLISVTGDFLFQTSALFLVLNTEKQNPELKTGLTSLLCTLPYLVFGLLAGAVADRFDRRKLMVLCDLARALLLLTTPWLYSIGALNWLGVGLVGFVLASFSALFNPARDAFISELAQGESLVRANAFVQSSYLVAMIGGTVLAGAILRFQIDRGVAEDTAIVRLFVIDGVSFLGSLLCLLLIRATPAERAPQATTMLGSARVGLSYLLSNRLLLSLLILTAIDNFFIMGPATVGANLLMKLTLGRSVDSVAWFESALALGWLCGTAALVRFGTRWPKGRVLLFGILMDGATFIPMLALGTWPSWPLALALIFIHGLFIAAITVPRASLIHENVPRELHGRVFSMVNLTVVGSMSLSAVTTGLMGNVVSPPMLYFIAGVGGTICGIVGFLVCKAVRTAR